MLKSNQKGQGLLEYIIISGLIGILCLVSIKRFGETLNGKVYDMKEAVNKNIKIETD